MSTHYILGTVLGVWETSVKKIKVGGCGIYDSAVLVWFNAMHSCSSDRGTWWCQRTILLCSQFWVKNSGMSTLGRTCLRGSLTWFHLDVRRATVGKLNRVRHPGCSAHVAWLVLAPACGLQCVVWVVTSYVGWLPPEGRAERSGGSNKAVWPRLGSCIVSHCCILLVTGKSLGWPRFEGRCHTSHLSVGSSIREVEDTS